MIEFYNSSSNKKNNNGVLGNQEATTDSKKAQNLKELKNQKNRKTNPKRAKNRSRRNKDYPRLNKNLEIESSNTRNAKEIEQRVGKRNFLLNDPILNPSENLRPEISSEELEITNFTVFSNQRVHCTFNDNSALILHKNRKCLTFHSNSGTKSRLLASEVPSHEHVAYKYQLLCFVRKFFNFRNFSYIWFFGVL